MKIKIRNFPHPVLNPVTDDFINSYFKARIVEQIENENSLFFTVEFDLKNQDLEELIALRKAKFTVHFECPTTMQRIKSSQHDSAVKVEIPSNLLNKKVDVNFFITADEDIENYTNDNTHRDFQGVSFKIKKGDILAFGESQTLHIEKKPLSKTNSIFKVSKDMAPDAPPIRITFTGNQIDISLPEVSYDKVGKIKRFGEDCNKVLVAMLYLPALIDTLFNIQSISDEEYGLDEIENLDWYRTLEKKLKNMGYDILDVKLEDITSISYKLLNSSPDSSWLALENIVYREGEDLE